MGRIRTQEVEDPASLVKLLLAQVDKLRETVSGQDGHADRLVALKLDVEALGRGKGKTNKRLKDVNARLDELAAKLDELLARKAAEGQRDWLNVPDDDGMGILRAWTWLDGLRTWVDDRFVVSTGRTLPECWPWHPRAVDDLLGLEDHRSAAYASTTPVHRSDYLGRYLPAAAVRLLGGPGAKDGILEDCVKEGQHQEPGIGAADVDLADLPEYVAWWALHRKGPPPGVTKV